MSAASSAFRSDTSSKQTHEPFPGIATSQEQKKAGTSRSRPGAITFRGHRRPRLFRTFDNTATLRRINPHHLSQNTLWGKRGSAFRADSPHE